jgi:transposase-like protein
MSTEVTIPTPYQQFNYPDEKWEKDESFCPVCGKQSVWVESGPGDCDVGPSYLCLECGSTFALPYCQKAGELDQKRIEAIKKSMRVP